MDYVFSIERDNARRVLVYRVMGVEVPDYATLELKWHESAFRHDSIVRLVGGDEQYCYGWVQMQSAKAIAQYREAQRRLFMHHTQGTPPADVGGLGDFFAPSAVLAPPPSYHEVRLSREDAVAQNARLNELAAERERERRRALNAAVAAERQRRLDSARERRLEAERRAQQREVLRLYQERQNNERLSGSTETWTLSGHLSWLADGELVRYITELRADWSSVEDIPVFDRPFYQGLVTEAASRGLDIPTGGWGTNHPAPRRGRRRGARPPAQPPAPPAPPKIVRRSLHQDRKIEL